VSDWQLDRLPGDVRQEAENAAQRDGLPLHRWLGKMIRDTCAEEGVAPSRELAPRAAIARHVNGGASDQRRAAAKITEVPREPAPQARATEPASPVAAPATPPPTARAINGSGLAAAFTAPRRDATAPAEPPRQTELRQAEPRREPARAASRPMPNADEVLANYPELTTPRRAAATAVPQSIPPAAAPSRLSPQFTAQQSTAPQAAAPQATAAPRPSARPPMPTTPPGPPTPAAAPLARSSAAQARAEERQAALAKLVASLQRNELSPIGEARVYLKLMTEHMASIGDITVATGRNRDQISRSLRLLSLSDRLRDLIDRGALSREQAFALLDHEDPDAASPAVPPSASGQRIQ